MENPIQVDARGLACPEPVVRARKAIMAGPGAGLEVLVSLKVQQENVARMARTLGCEVTEEERSGHFAVVVAVPGAAQAAKKETAPAAEPVAPREPARPVVYVRSAVMGVGDADLGRILMKAFLKTLREMDPLPSAILFLNSGIHLTTEGSEELPVLRELGARGVEIVSCGTCLDFYKKLDQLRVGIAGNMFDILTKLHEAPKVISP